MAANLAFVLGLLDTISSPSVTAEDFAGAKGVMLRRWQELGFLSTVPERHPVASCPYCWSGVPYHAGTRYLCGLCGSSVEERFLYRWRFELRTFLQWLSRVLQLEGDVRSIDERLWQLGTWRCKGLLHECFYCGQGPLREAGQQRLSAFRRSVLLRPLPDAEPITGFTGQSLSLLELLQQEGEVLQVQDMAYILRSRGAVRFDPLSGVLWVGGVWMGEVPIGSKEYHFLAYLSLQLDRFVPYADLKEAVLREAGSGDTTEEATFCQRLKSRIKRWVPQLDALIVTTNKGDGYRLRGYVEL